jgi:hypothetical protein
VPNLLDGFLDFCPRLLIPSRDAGVIPLWPLLGTQTYLHAQIIAGLAEDIHDFVVLKGGRQIGGSTYMDALCCWYLPSYSGMVGMMVSDEDDNRDYRRDLILSMIDSLPRTHRQGVRRDNARMLAWNNNATTGYRGSRLLFAAAGKRPDANLGRSKGTNFGYDDELGSWYDDKAYSSLRAGRSAKHPHRLYVGISTARGRNTVFHDAWKTAQTAVTQRAIFVACWREPSHVLTPADTALWARYALEHGALTDEERHWRDDVQRRYGHTLTLGFFAWYRWKLTEEFRGDETMMAQEYGLLPEECFQSFGDKFIEAYIVRRLEEALAQAPTPHGYRYEWGRHLTDLRPVPTIPSGEDLRIWEEPDPAGYYLVAAHPQYASGPRGQSFVVQVWRAYPDRIVQVAEYAADSGYMHKFAWVCLHLCGAYRSWEQVYFILEIAMSGQHVLAEMDRMENFGRGLGPTERGTLNRVVNALGAVHHLYRRLDSFTGSVLRQNKVTPEIRSRILYALRDEIERQHLVIRSAELVDELAVLRRGEEGDADEIAGGGESDESRAYTAALAVEAYLSQTVQGYMGLLAPDLPPPGGSTRVENVLVGDFIARLGRAE